MSIWDDSVHSRTTSRERIDTTSRITRQLREDAEDISRSLDAFLAERALVSKKANEALALFDAELADIGDTNDDIIPEPSVDHNVMRHLNLVKSGPEKDEYDDYENDGFDYDDENIFDEKHQKEIEEKHRALGLGLIKREIPSFEQKNDLRNNMFSYLDRCRIEELQLEVEYDRLRDNDDPEAESVAEALYSVRKRNSGGLLEMIDDYQPLAFGRAWGNDPDYINITRKLNVMMSTTSPQELALKMREIVDEDFSKSKNKKNKSKSRK